MNKFINKYQITEEVINKQILKVDFDKNVFLFNLIKDYGGKIFNKGLFKIHTFEMVSKWTNVLSQEYFKDELKDVSYFCFGSNWQGCMYCINKKNNLIIYFDPATCEFFESEDTSIEDFFNSVLVDGEYDIIFEEYFEEVYKYLELDKINYEESIGHKVYLHLGGEDDKNNLEIVNTEVLWDLQIQIANKINEIT